MKHRKTKLSLGLKIASILSCVAILSAGFAAWCIVQTPSKLLENGSFTVYTVTQKEITVTNASITPATIVFGKPTSTTTSTTWLVAKDESGAPMATDVLTATLTFTVGIKDDTETALNELVDDITITFAPNDATKTNFNTAITGVKVNDIDKSYIAAPTITGDGITSVSAYNTTDSNLVVSIPAANTNTMTVTATITFDWGTLTGGDNPFDYYNTKDYATYSAEALLMLQKVALLKDGGYNITIGATLPTA